MVSSRATDINGFVTIKRNPISRSGIFQYSGAQIGLDAEPNKVYNVYRPAEEWQNAEALDSVKHVPWIDDHVMLGGVGSEFTSPDHKGIHGITCDDVSFENGTVYANLKIFSRTLADLVERGKRELSLGFRCAYEKAAGVFDGKDYSYIQRSIRANHLALVDRGRAGPNVAVLDNATAFDHFDLALDLEEGSEMPEETKPAFDMAELVAAIGTAVDAAVDKAVSPIKQSMDTISAKMAADEVEKKAKEDADKEKKDDEDKEGKAAMDAALATAAELPALRDELTTVKTALDEFKTSGLKVLMDEAAKGSALASRLYPFTGVFDHAGKSEAEIAAYAVDHLKLPAEGADKLAVLNGFLHNRPAPSPDAAYGLDTANPNATPNTVDAFFATSK